MGIPDATKLASCQAASDIGDWFALFDGASGTTGANEASGVTRVQGSWSNQTASVKSNSVNIPCPAGTYKEAGVFSAKTSGTFAGAGAFSGGDVVVSGTGGSIDVTITWS